MRLLLRAIALCGLLALGGCSGTTTAGTATAPPAPSGTADRQSPAPSRTASVTIACTPDMIEARVRQFLDAFNRGNQATLAGFFGPDFQWYSVTEGNPTAGGQLFLAYNPDGSLRLSSLPPGSKATIGHQEILLPYFAARHAHGDLLHPRQIAVSVRSGGQLADFTYELTREADDLPPGLGGPQRTVLGKGAMSCPAGTIVVWSMGMDQQ